MPEGVASIGVVAIGRNEGDRLIRCLRSLSGAAGPVVYVDSASTDGSAQSASELGAIVLSLDMSRPFTAARARAEGFSLLESYQPGIERVMFIDGDCEVDPGWMEAATEFLAKNSDFAVVCGRRRERSPDDSPYNLLIDREWNTPIGEAEACGGDAVFQCAAYREVGGFDAHMIAGEEPELCSRLRTAGWRIMRLDAPMTVHDAAIERFSQWWHRAVRSGMGYAQAWCATRQRGQSALYRRELARAIGWAGALPLAATSLGIFVEPALFMIWPLATAAQALRITLREGYFAAFLAIVGKYAEFLGAMRFTARVMRGKTGSTVEYK